MLTLSPITPAQSVHALLGDEGRKQRRRECHNQVEKRRREHINAMIEELNKLLPPRFKNPMDPDVAIEDDEDEEATTESPVKKKVCPNAEYLLTDRSRSARRRRQSHKRMPLNARVVSSATAFSISGAYHASCPTWNFS